MKNTILSILLCFFVLLDVQSQTSLSNPTDVVYYEQGNAYFVSNWADGNGYVSLVDKDWIVLSSYAIDFDFAGGMCLVDQVLYVADNGDLWGGSLPSYLVAIDIVQGVEAFRIEISTGGTYLDLMTTDNNGNLYICDSEKFKIYKFNIATQEVSTFLDVESKPLGICYDHIDDRLIFTESKSTVSYLKSVSLDGGEVTHEFDRPGWIEGITMDDEGNFYITSWSGATTAYGDEPVVKISHSFDFEYEMANDLNRPFGLDMGHGNYLVVCNWGQNSLYPIDLTPFGTNDLIGKQALLEVSPNPTSGKVWVKIPEEISGSVRVHVLDLQGRTVWAEHGSEEVPDGKKAIDLNLLPPGVYVLVLETESGAYRSKLVIQ